MLGRPLEMRTEPPPAADPGRPRPEGLPRGETDMYWGRFPPFEAQRGPGAQRIVNKPPKWLLFY